MDKWGRLLKRKYTEYINGTNRNMFNLLLNASCFPILVRTVPYGTIFCPLDDSGSVRCVFSSETIKNKRSEVSCFRFSVVFVLTQSLIASNYARQNFKIHRKQETYLDCIKKFHAKKFIWKLSVLTPEITVWGLRA